MLLKKAFYYYKLHGLRLTLNKIHDYFLRKSIFNAGFINLFERNKNFKIGFDWSPLVSILLVSYNSRKEILELMGSINKQSYKNIEIIIVENGDQDNSDLVNHIDASGIYVEANNVGFAAANNLAYEYSRGSHVFLLNPDTKLDYDTIEKLIDVFRYEKDVAAAAPKILFSHKFIDVIISSSSKFCLDLEKIMNKLTYKKIIHRCGTVKSTIDGQILHSIEKSPSVNEIVLSLPVDGSIIDLQMFTNDAYSIVNCNVDTKFSILNKFNEESNLVGRVLYTINLDPELLDGKFIINNAGSGLKNGYPFDQGFGLYDYGLIFSQPSYVSGFCGAAVLLGPNVLAKRKIFIDEFFAYYEDSELSNYLIENKFKIKYVPYAVVLHDHSTSSVENSPLWNNLVGRSKSIYERLVFDKDNAIKYHSRHSLPKNLHDKLDDYDANIIAKNRQKLILKKRPSICIYNTYWKTKGGGEKHALAFASLFEKYCDIFLLSETDFNEKEIAEYFGLKFKFRKLITPVVNTEVTSCFDIFINSTFCSNLISRAPVSIFLCSFPQRRVSRKFLKSYFFLHNSEYTKMWADKYWGQHKSLIFYPTLKLSKRIIANHSERKNIISVGRITKGGHFKNHDKIIKSFVNSQKYNQNNIKLIICGSLNFENFEDNLYFQELKNISCKSVEIYPNVSREKLIELYNDSEYYVHAAGVGVNEQKNPELLEHFGITVAEAIQNKLIPIVYDKGGPAEILEKLKIGYVFSGQDELSIIFKKIMTEDNDTVDMKVSSLDYFVKHNDKVIKQIMNLSSLKI